MAEINSVPLGQAGTGSAFVLGGSQAANQLLDTLQYNQQIAQQQEKLKLAQAQQLANSWKTNQLKVDGGLYWQPEFNKRYQSHLQKGIELRQMGVDPFNYNPNDPTQSKIAENYLLERQGILADTANRKATEAELKKSFDAIRKDPNKYYASDIATLNKFIETPYSEAQNMPIPSLSERFDPNVVLAKITPAQIGSEIVVGNKRIKSVKALPQETREAIVGAYKNDTGTQRWVDELTGGQGFTIPVLERIPDTKEAVKSAIESNYKGNPDLRAQLATQGILPNSDSYKQYVNQETERLYQAKSKWNAQLQSDLNQVLPKVKEMSSSLPDYGAEDQAIQRRRLALAEEANNRARTTANKKVTDETVLYRQKLVNDMLSGVAGSGETVKGIVEAKPEFTEELKINIDGEKIHFVVPDRITSKVVDGKPKSTAIAGRTVTIDRNDPSAPSKMNELLNDVTGEKIAESKFKSGNASGKVKTTKTTTSKPKKTIKGF